MTQDIVSYEGKTFEDLITPFNEAQRDYLYLRVKGIGVGESLRLANRKPQTGRVWRLDDPNFKILEAYLIEHKDIYAPQASAHFSSRLAKITFGLMELADRLNDWENVTPSERPYILRACEILIKIHSNGHTPNEGYEEMLFRIRRKGVG